MRKRCCLSSLHLVSAGLSGQFIHWQFAFGLLSSSSFLFTIVFSVYLANPHTLTIAIGITITCLVALHFWSFIRSFIHPSTYLPSLPSLFLPSIHAIPQHLFYLPSYYLFEQRSNQIQQQKPTNTFLSFLSSLTYTIPIVAH